MPSTLTWLDHDRTARERSLRILALFRVRDSRDELGLGAIRDSFSDKLFPGTSTIQTRLRYMLFVPWVYRELEAKQVSADRFAARARQLELELIEPLLDSDDRAGVFGIGAGKALKRLPSDVYWSGLGAWRIRRYQGSLDEYHRGIDRIYALRGRRREHEDDDDAVHPASVTWHSHLPEPPEDFPYGLSFALTREEAEFLRDAIVTSCPETLLAWLAREGRAGRADLPWEHPDLARFPGRDRALLQQARLFSLVMLGAAIVYNLALAKLDGRRELEDEHRAHLGQWASELGSAGVSAWLLDELWAVTADSRHTVTPGARRFVERWVGMVKRDPYRLADDPAAYTLVAQREQKLKRGHSRFRNARAREQWSGRAGLRQMTYRWDTVRSFLDDLHRGLRLR